MCVCFGHSDRIFSPPCVAWPLRQRNAGTLMVVKEEKEKKKGREKKKSDIDEK